MSDIRGGSGNAVFRGKKAEKRHDFFRNQDFFGGDKRDQTADLLDAMAPHAKTRWKYVY